jgi:hypothetical protein
MWTALGAGVDFIHAIAMAAWVVGFPLLFVQRWPHARLAYATYAVLFVVLSQTSMFLLHECFLTKVASWCWGHDPSHFASNDWFTERLARAIFGMAPSRHLIARLSEALVLATVAGVILSVVHVRRHASTRTRPGSSPPRGAGERRELMLSSGRPPQFPWQSAKPERKTANGRKPQRAMNRPCGH